MTGRKIVAGYLPVALPTTVVELSLGKDPSKVDRSAAYMARKITKDFVREGCLKAAVMERSLMPLGLEPVVFM
ncbi:methionine adenosyltransferase domain-containing protein [Streptococcus agalactiae]